MRGRCVMNGPASIKWEIWVAMIQGGVVAVSSCRYNSIQKALVELKTSKENGWKSPAGGIEQEPSSWEAATWQQTPTPYLHSNMLMKRFIGACSSMTPANINKWRWCSKVCGHGVTRQDHMTNAQFCSTSLTPTFRPRLPGNIDLWAYSRHCY